MSEPTRSEQLKTLAEAGVFSGTKTAEERVQELETENKRLMDVINRMHGQVDLAHARLASQARLPVPSVMAVREALEILVRI